MYCILLSTHRCQLEQITPAPSLPPQFSFVICGQSLSLSSLPVHATSSIAKTFGTVPNLDWLVFVPLKKPSCLSWKIKIQIISFSISKSLLHYKFTYTRQKRHCCPSSHHKPKWKFIKNYHEWDFSGYIPERSFLQNLR